MTPNPALDYTVRVRRLERGESHRVPAAAVRAGGKGVNVARVVHQQGLPVLAVTSSGGGTGEEFAAELMASGIPHTLVPVAAATRRSTALVDESRGQTTVFNEHGVNHSVAEWHALTDATAAALPGASCLVGSGSVPRGADTAFFAHLVAIARTLGVPSVIDTSGHGLLAAARAGATVLKPNRQELCEATGDVDVERAARGLLELGARLVLVSLGEEGMLAFSAAEPHSPWRARLPRVLVGNATGAGDAAVAAVAVALAEGTCSPELILGRATSWSAAAVLMPLAGEISPAHVDLEAEVTIDRPDGAPRGTAGEESPCHSFPPAH